MSTDLVKAPRRSLIESMGAKYGVEPDKFLSTIKNTAFKGATNEQLMALMVVADQYNLNPFLKEIYAFPDKKGGVVPVVGVDGWTRIINENPAFDGAEFEEDEAACTCTIYRKDRGHPTVVTEYLSECKGTSEPWKKWPKRMLRHKALIQCARLAFGYSGIYDPDEADRIRGVQYCTERPSIGSVLTIESDHVEEVNEMVEETGTEDAPTKLDSYIMHINDLETKAEIKELLGYAREDSELTDIDKDVVAAAAGKRIDEIG